MAKRVSPSSASWNQRGEDARRNTKCSQWRRYGFAKIQFPVDFTLVKRCRYPSCIGRNNDMLVLFISDNSQSADVVSWAFSNKIAVRGFCCSSVEHIISGARAKHMKVPLYGFGHSCPPHLLKRWHRRKHYENEDRIAGKITYPPNRRLLNFPAKESHMFFLPPARFYGRQRGNTYRQQKHAPERHLWPRGESR